MRREFKPSLSRPADFDLFWNSTRMQLERIDPQLERIDALELHPGAV